MTRLWKDKEMVIIISILVLLFILFLGGKSRYNKRQCEKGNHRWGLFWKKGYAKVSRSTAVAEKEKRTIKKCKRCGETEGEWETKFIDSFQGLTLSSDRMEVFDKNRWLTTGIGWSNLEEKEDNENS